MHSQKSPRASLSLNAYWNARLAPEPDARALLQVWAKTIKRAMEYGARGCVVALLREEEHYITRPVLGIQSPRGPRAPELVLDAVYDVHTHALLEHASQSKLQRVVCEPTLVQALRELGDKDHGLCFWLQTESRRGLLPHWLELYVYWTPENDARAGALYAYWLALMTKGELFAHWTKRVQRAMSAGQRMVALFTVQATVDYGACKPHDDSPLRVPSARAYLTLAPRSDTHLVLNARHARVLEWITTKQGLNWCLLLEDSGESGVLAVYRGAG